MNFTAIFISEKNARKPESAFVSFAQISKRIENM